MADLIPTLSAYFSFAWSSGRRRRLLSQLSHGLIILLLLILASCSQLESRVAILWTDRPEFVEYVEAFNLAQSRYKLEVCFQENPAQALIGTSHYPDLVVGGWLKSSATRSLFKALDYFFDDLLLSRNAFYTKLLDLGFIDGKQYLLPVSFNIPALIFSRENTALVAANFTLDLDELADLSLAYNEKKTEAFIKMGFSPRWNDEFLFQTAVLFGAAFREGSPLAWNVVGLEQAISFVRNWTSAVNGSITAEDDFQFKYLYDPSPKLATSGRIFFAYMTSEDLFTVPAEMRAVLDFRWLAKDQTIPVIEGAPYLGICKRGKAGAAADAFVQWFYKTETQRALLVTAKNYRSNETVFGIANGFSALRSVNEQIYPQFYPGLLGHVPPADYLSPPGILPKDWINLKQRVVLPYLRERCGIPDEAPTPALAQWITDWYRDPI